MDFKKDIDRYKKKKLTSVPFPSPFVMGLTGSSKLHQEAPEQSNNTAQYQYKNQSWEKKERQLGHCNGRKEDRYKHDTLREKCVKWAFCVFKIFGLLQGLLQRWGQNYKQNQITVTALVYMQPPPAVFFVSFNIHMWHDITSLLNMPTPPEKHWFHNSCVQER